MHTTAITTVSNGTWIDVLSTSVTTGDSVLSVSTSGGIVNPGLSSTSYVNVLVRVVVDGIVAPALETRSYEVALASGTVSTNWSFSVTKDVGPGSHTVVVQASRLSGNVSAQVGGADNSAFRGALTVLVLNH